MALIAPILLTVLVVVLVPVLFLVTRRWTRSRLSSPGSSAARDAQMSELYRLGVGLEGTGGRDPDKPAAGKEGRPGP